MPSTIAHTYFSLDVYDKLEPYVQNKLKDHLEYFKTFSQGPDLFYFYNLTNFKKGKHINKLGDFIQRNKTKDFFITLITAIKKDKLDNQPEILSFLYGFLCHYVLDSTLHPYIIYKTGIYYKKDKKTFKYRGLHNDLESYLDAYLIFKKENYLPKYFKPHKFTFNVKKLSFELTNLIDETFFNVYQKRNISKIYLKSIQHAKLFNYIYRYDKYGFKKKCYKLIDLISPRFFRKKEFLSYYQDPFTKEHYLNLDKNEWNHPLNKYEVSHYSLIELYVIAIKKTVDLINNVNKILEEKKELSYLNNIFDNSSYATGKDCNLGHNFKYFEF